MNLDQMIELGVKRALEVRKVGAEVSGSKIDLYDAVLDLLPTPSSSYEYRKTGDIFDTTTYTYSLDFGQRIFDTRTIYNIINGSDRLRLAQSNLSETVSDLIYEITTGYIDLIIGFSTHKNLRLAQARAEENYRLVRARYEIGSVSRLDLIQAEIARLRVQKDLIKSETDIAILEEHLSNLLDTQGYIIPVDTLTRPAEKIEIEGLKKTLFKQNPQILSAKIGRKMAHRDLIFSYLDMLPVFSVFLSYRYHSYQPPGSIGEIKDNLDRSFGLRFDLPIFNLKDIILGISKAQVRKRQAELELLLTKRRNEEELARAVLELKTSRSNIDLTTKNLDAAREALRMAQERYRTGSTSLLSLLTAQEDLNEAEASYLRALGDYHRALARISYLIGRGVR
ncbi:MAG TPA: TolC family protein [bacterium (Candidatus Stahlbacteria)]|nr:TolC family protein [Candidatus Stahlbacteria bacterium]